MAFQYGGRQRRTEDVVRRSKGGGNYDSIFKPDYPVFKPKEGENSVRILPPSWLKFDKKGQVIEDEAYEKWGGHWDLRVFVHFGIGADEATYICNAKMNDEPCAPCDARRDAEDDDERKQFRWSERSVCWVIDRADEKAGPQVWGMPASLSRDIYGRSVDKKTGAMIYIDDPEEGYDIDFIREGTDVKTKYTGVDVARKASPISSNEKQQDRWLDYITEHPLPDVLNFFEPEYIEKVLLGKVDKSKNEEEEVEDDPKPARGGRRAQPADEEEVDDPPPRRGGRAAAPVEEDEDDAPPPKRGGGVARNRPAAEPVEDEDDAPPPRRGSAARSRPAPAEEDEDDPPPPRRGARAKPVEEDEIPSEDEDGPPPRSSKNGRRVVPHDDEDDVDPDTGELTPTQQAKKQLGRLKTGAGRR